ncbi:MAG: hypothetical protein ACXWMX_02595 [Candidatus Limnocylindrales bacterium]
MTQPVGRPLRPSDGPSVVPPNHAAGSPPLRILADAPDESGPAAVITTWPTCRPQLQERKCKLLCTCGYFLSCSDYY